MYIKKTDNPKMGRPKKQLDYDLIDKLALLQCTEEEIAFVCDCNVRTLQRDEEFCRIYKKGKMQGKISLRRKQWKLADKNAAMAIFLGKQYLGQSDKLDAKLENNNAELLKGYMQMHSGDNQ